jgi:hypothetical protein
MYNIIGNGGSEGNIGEFDNERYFSSTEAAYHSAWSIIFNFGITDSKPKITKFKVRPICSF